LKKIISILFILSFSLVFSQNAKVDSLKVLLNSSTDKYEIAKTNLQLAKLYEQIDVEKGKEFAKNALLNHNSDSLLAETNYQLGRFMFFTAQLDSAEYFFLKSLEIFTRMNDKDKAASINIGIGAIQLRQGEYNKTIKTLTETAAYFEETGDKLNAAKCYNNISSALAELENYPKAIEYNEKALQVFNEQNLTQFQIITLPNLAAQHYKNGDTIQAINYNLQAEKLAIDIGNKRALSIIYNNLGSIYLNREPEKARDYLEKTIQLKTELNLKSGIEVTQGNLGYLHLKNKEYQKAANYYKQMAEQVNGKQLVFAYDQLQICYKNLNLPAVALEFSEKSRQLNDSLLNAENQKVFAEIQTRYETEKKEKEIKELETTNLEVEFKRKINQNLFLATFGILLLTILMVYNMLKSSKRKRKVAEQELKIKNQVLIEQLKTQELNGIDAIIDAQEKEQSRIADDLHDNLGSKIATLKLYIQEINSEKNDSSEKENLLNKLTILADETYKEVRKIAHDKNTGALINKGLIPSIKTIANEISISEKLQIEVNNINVNKRIKNNIEIQVFRIVQELLTNIIKHAEASEVTIQFSEDENMLNVMVEDNGKGFDVNNIVFGMGLKNIEKRLEKIDGNIVIDSTPGNGTTIILNIPL
jgi:hypothetical protein